MLFRSVIKRSYEYISLHIAFTVRMYLLVW